MHRVLEAEQIEYVYEAADRCRRCKEISCKQPSFVEVVFCPRFNPIEVRTNQKDSNAKTGKKRIAQLR